jgi:hypothetical protein
MANDFPDLLPVDRDCPCAVERATAFGAVARAQLCRRRQVPPRQPARPSAAAGDESASPLTARFSREQQCQGRLRTSAGLPLCSWIRQCGGLRLRLLHRPTVSRELASTVARFWRIRGLLDAPREPCLRAGAGICRPGARVTPLCPGTVALSSSQGIDIVARFGASGSVARGGAADFRIVGLEQQSRDSDAIGGRRTSDGLSLHSAFVAERQSPPTTCRERRLPRRMGIRSRRRRGCVCYRRLSATGCAWRGHCGERQRDRAPRSQATADPQTSQARPRGRGCTG